MFDDIVYLKVNFLHNVDKTVTQPNNPLSIGFSGSTHTVYYSVQLAQITNYECNETELQTEENKCVYHTDELKDDIFSISFVALKMGKKQLLALCHGMGCILVTQAHPLTKM